MPVELWKTLRSTNVIESVFSIVRVVCRYVKRWRPGNQIERWVGSGLVVAEMQSRRIDGYRAFARPSRRRDNVTKVDRIC